MIRVILFTIFLTCYFLAANGQKIHTVKEGETIESIAKKYHVATDELMKENTSAEILFPGLLLTIPQKTAQVKKEERAKVEPKLDKVEMWDGSYIICKVVNIRKTTVVINQKEIAGNITLPIKDVIEIFYANGTRKRFGKR